MTYGYYDNLPDKLSEEELIELFKKYKNGDKKAFEKIYLHNLRFVHFFIGKNFFNLELDREELFAVGCYGLQKAILTFDIGKVKFLSYASVCIKNEILMFLRKEKRRIQGLDVSLDEPVISYNNGQVRSYEDILADTSVSIEENFFHKERLKYIRKIVEEIPDERNKEIIKLFFGFDGREPISQLEISKKFNLSQSYTSRIVTRTLKYIALKLKELEELPEEDFLSEKKPKVNPTVYDLLDCSKKEFLLIYPKLEIEEQKDLSFLLQADFNKPFVSSLPLDKIRKLIEKIKNLVKFARENSKLNDYGIERQQTISVRISDSRGAIISEEKDIEEQSKKKMPSKKENVKSGRKLQSIYSLLKEYTKEEIDAVISTLEEEDKRLLWLRYGADLEHPVENPLWKKECSNKFYSLLIGKIKRRLANGINIRRGKKIQSIYSLLKEYTKEEIDAVISTLEEEDKRLIWLRYGDDLEHPVENSLWRKEYHSKFYIVLIGKIRKKLAYYRMEKEKLKESALEKRELDDTLPLNTENINTLLLSLTKNILKTLRLSDYQYLLENFSLKEIIVTILVMKMTGNYTIKEIADFMKISEKEVIEISKRIISLYRETINKYFDSLLKTLDSSDIEVISEEVKELKKVNKVTN